MLHKYLPGDTRERIKDLLTERGMNQEELAEKLGVNGSTINRYLSGQTEKLSTENIVEMARIFNVSTDFLLCLTDIPFKTNYDIEKLGLNVDAAKTLLRKEYDMDILNTLLTMRDFKVMVNQLSELTKGTMEAGVEGVNQMITSTISLLTEYAAAYPSDRNAAKQAILEIQGQRQPEYEAETDALEATLHRIIDDFKAGAEDYIVHTRKLTSNIMDRLVSHIKKNLKDPMKLRGITPEIIVNQIMRDTEKVEMSDETREKFHAGLLAMFEEAKHFSA
ncbi:MAG: helix-turn-helix transcriptional regulator [Clostridia bacterium]|nr:helix-turn-helix transcriptional regulator [Clostridia bacterium]